MFPEQTMKKRINALFWVLCLTVAVQIAMSYVMQVFVALRQIGLPISDYVMSFIAPQFLYPMMNLLLVFVAVWVMRMPLRPLLRMSAPRRSFLPWLGLFLGVATAGNLLVSLLLAFLEEYGVTVPDVFSQYNPQTPGQAVAFFVVVAVLPAISEEVLFRAMTAGGLKEYHPWAAVWLSAFGFGFIHANLQQIPFAILLGLVLGLVYVKTDNLLYPILLHFVNNAWACALTFLGIFVDPDLALSVRMWGSLLFLIFGIVSFVWLLCKKGFSLKEYPRAVSGVQALRSALASLGMWVFFALYLLLTVLMTALPV